MIIAKVTRIDSNLELCDVEVHEDGAWVESSRSESVEEFERRIEEFLDEYFLKTGRTVFLKGGK